MPTSIKEERTPWKMETKCKGCKKLKECKVYGYASPEPYAICESCEQYLYDE